MRSKFVLPVLIGYLGLSAIGSALLVARGIARAPIVGLPVTALTLEHAVVGMLSIVAAIALGRRSATGWWLSVVLVATTLVRRAPEFLLPWEGEPRPGLLIALRVLFLLSALLAMALLIGYRSYFLRKANDCA